MPFLRWFAKATVCVPNRNPVRYSRLAPPQLALLLVTFQTAAVVFVSVHAGAAGALSVGAAAALPW